MRRLTKRSAPAAGILGCLAVLLFPGTADAEIGATPQGGPADPFAPYIVIDVIDEPDPFSGIWRPVRPEEGGRVVLNAGGADNGDGRPDVALHPTTRVPFVVWSRQVAGGYDVVVSRFVDGAWTAPEVVADELEDTLDPRVAIDPASGDVHLVYWVDGATPRVEHRQAPADLSTWSSPTVVSDAGEAACRPHAVFHDGALRVAYEVHVSGPGSTPRLVVLARREGAAFTPEIVATTQFGGDVRVEVHSHAGALWIDWVDAEGEMGWTRFEGSTATWEPVRLEPFGSFLEREFHVRGAIRSQATQ